jgi:ACS family hexuronate transporter-like MFS transporter
VTQDGDGAVATWHGWAISLAAAFSVAIAFLDRQTMSVLAPVVTRELGVSDVQYGVLASVFGLALLVGSSVAGTWTVRLGARRALLLAVVGWSVVAVSHSLAAGFLSLLLLRAGLGLSESPSLPAAIDAIHLVLPARSQPRATGFLFAGSSVGVLVAAPLAVSMQQRFGWRAAFGVSAAIGLLLWVPAWYLLTRPRAVRRVMDSGAGRAQAAGIERVLNVLGDRAIRRTVVVVAGVMPLIAFTTIWEGKWLVHDFGLPPARLGHYLILGPLLFDLGALTFGHLASRRIALSGRGTSPRLLVAAAAALVVGGDLAAPFAASALIAITWNGVAAIGRGAILPLVVSDMARGLPAPLVARGTAAVNGVQALTLVVANPIIGYLVQHHGYRTALVGISLWAAPMFGWWLVATRGAAPAIDKERPLTALG